MPQPPSPSLYAATTPPAPPFSPLTGQSNADVAVIGGGIAGLSCALHVAEHGAKVTLLEAHDIGWGASGRNGGQVNPGLKLSPRDLERQFGTERGARLTALGAAGPDLVFSLIERFAMECGASRNGTLRAVKSARQAMIAKELAEDYARAGVPARFLTAQEVQAMTGTDHYHGALFDARGGALNPLAFTRGLAREAEKAGARIHTQSPATALKRIADGWQITTPQATLTARHVALCANAYQSALIPGLAASQVPVYSMMSATAPLPRGLRETIMPSGSVLYEQADITVYYRLDEHRRLLIGGRSPSRDLRPGDTKFLRHYAAQLWPALRGIGWTYDWNGQLSMTTDHLPHLHEPMPGLTAVLGCNGRGVALMTILGQRLAARINGGDVAEFVLPISPVNSIPLHRFWKLGVAIRVAYGQIRFCTHCIDALMFDSSSLGGLGSWLRRFG